MVEGPDEKDLEAAAETSDNSSEFDISESEVNSMRHYIEGQSGNVGRKKFENLVWRHIVVTYPYSALESLKQRKLLELVVDSAFPRPTVIAGRSISRARSSPKRRNYMNRESRDTQIQKSIDEFNR